MVDVRVNMIHDGRNAHHSGATGKDSIYKASFCDGA